LIDVIPNFYEPNDKNLKIKRDENKKIVLTIGSLTEYKNPFLWVQVAKELIRNSNDNIFFIWAGDGPLLTKCKELSLGIDQINFIGHVEHVSSLYESAYIYFQPSLIESQGIAVIGAMYHSLPCVVSNRGGLKESVQNNFNGFIVNIENIFDSINALTLLLSDTLLQTKMGIQSSSIYKDKFTYDIWFKKMNQILK
jgi:glycosyltransferase involved in cell wall biosynthesis